MSYPQSYGNGSHHVQQRNIRQSAARLSLSVKVLVVAHVGLFNQQMKISVKNNINTDSGELSLLMWEPHFSSHLLLDRQKDEYLCSFIEMVPRLVIHHSQSVFQFLLRLAASSSVVVVVVVVLLLLLLLLLSLLSSSSKKVFKIASLRS